MRRIFISYSHRDAEQVEEIRTSLTGLAYEGRVTLWQDNRSIVAGDEWERKLWEALGDADVVLACLSRYYFASPWCQQELEEALQQGILLVPCRIRPCRAPKVEHRQFAVGGQPLSEVWDQPHERELWLDQLVADVERAILPGTPPVVTPALPTVDPDLLAGAFELTERFAPADPVAGLEALWRTDPDGARAVLRQLAVLTGEPVAIEAKPEDAPPRPVKRPPPAEPVVQSESVSSPWTRYWRSLLDRTVPWSTLSRHVATTEVGGGHRAYLVVGEPSQEPQLFASRMRSYLPSHAVDEARRPAVVGVSFPDPDFVAVDALDVQRQCVMALCEHPEFPELHPSHEPRVVLGQAARKRPVIFVLGQPLRATAVPQLGALEAFARGLDQFLGSPEGRWPVRVVVVVEEVRGGPLHGRLLRALQAGPIAFEPFDPLHFPPWAEVYDQLRTDEHFVGLDDAALANARHDYTLAVTEVASLTQLADRLLTTLDRLKESR